jgi:hypothetical protein
VLPKTRKRRVCSFTRYYLHHSGRSSDLASSSAVPKPCGRSHGLSSASAHSSMGWYASIRLPASGLQ